MLTYPTTNAAVSAWTPSVNSAAGEPNPGESRATRALSGFSTNASNSSWQFRLPFLAISLVANGVGADVAVANENATNRVVESRLPRSFAVSRGGATEGMEANSDWLSTWLVFEGARAMPRATISSLLQDLSQIEDGWNGERSVAPSGYVREDIEKLNYLAISEWRTPDVELDNDGTVALRWEGDDHLVALTFNGNGRVIGTMFPRIDGVPQEMSLRDQMALSHFLAIPEVKSAIS